MHAVLDVGAAIGAVPSGRSVSERSLRSANVYISFWTTSEPSPDVRAKSPVSSKPGVWMRRSRRGGRPRPSCSRRCHQRLLGRQDVVRPARRLELRHRSVTRVMRYVAGARSSARNGFVSSSRPSVVAGPCPGYDHRLRREAVEQRAHRLQQRLPVATGQVDPPDRSGEEQIAREERPAASGTRRDRTNGPGRRSPRRRCRRARSRRRPSTVCSGSCAGTRACRGRLASGRGGPPTSPAGAHTSAPVPSASAATPPMWSTSVCVTRMPAARAPIRASSRRSWAASAPGSITAASAAPRSRADDVAVRLERARAR